MFIKGSFVAVRVEYLKARARRIRYQEQIQLIIEEKRRVLESLKHDALVWDKREEESLEDLSPEGQGRAAYAARQAAMRRSLATKFALIWEEVPTPPKPAPGDAENPRPLIIGGDVDEESDDSEDESELDE